MFGSFGEPGRFGPLGTVVAVVVGLSALLVAGAPEVRAEEADAGEPTGQAEVRRVIPGSERDLFWVDHKFSLRFRPELLLAGDLGNGASPVPTPLEGDDSRTLAWAALRMRYEPTLNIGRELSIHVGIDAFDNLVMGSTPARQDFTQGLWEDSAVPPRAGINAWTDAIRARYIYGRWNAFNFLDMRVGRMPSHFGLGIFRNSGDCADCDFGSVVDAATVQIDAFGARIAFDWEYTASGALDNSPGIPGQVVDLGQEDDVSTYILRIGAVPPDTRELERRESATGELWVDWAVLGTFTDQPLSSNEQPEPEAGCDVVAFADGNVQLPYECTRLIPRDAFFFRPAAWVKLFSRFEHLTSLRAELEFGAVFGSVTNLQRIEGEETDKSVTAFGGALEVEYRSPVLRAGLDTGFATGDNGDFLGYLDGQNILEPDDNLYEENTNVRDNEVITSYWFNRDYRLDLILFRQIIGGVTNAVYIKPWIAGDLLDTGSFRLGGRLDVLYAAAVQPSGTPGEGQHWGVEIDGRLELELDEGISSSLAAGLLIPLDALDGPNSGAAGDLSFALQGMISWDF